MVSITSLTLMADGNIHGWGSDRVATLAFVVRGAGMYASTYAWNWQLLRLRERCALRAELEGIDHLDAAVFKIEDIPGCHR